MNKQILNYENMIRITKAIGHSRDPEEVTLMAVEAIKTGLGAKGCALFLIDKKTHELRVAASFGLSREYLDKGPISALKSIAASLEDGPVAVMKSLKQTEQSMRSRRTPYEGVPISVAKQKGRKEISA